MSTTSKPSPASPRIRRALILLIGLVLGALLLTIQSAPALARADSDQPRLALVIGNAECQHLTRLRNPDAKAVAARLSASTGGFYAESVATARPAANRC